MFKVDGPDILIRVGDVESLLSGANVLLLNPWTQHSYAHKPRGRDPLVLELSLDTDWMKSIDERSLISHPNFFAAPTVDSTDEVKSSVRALTDVLAFVLDPTEAAVESNVREVVRFLIDHCVNWKALSPCEAIGGLQCDKRIRKVLAVEQPRSVEEMAQAAGMSRSHFFNSFKQATRVTPAEFANMLRIEKALRLMADTRHTVSEIGLLLGYESPGNFTRFFRAQQGMPPTEFRRGND